MTGNDYPAETLNAYVDGELNGPEAAALVRDLVGNPTLAQRVSELTALKATVRTIYDDLPCKSPDLQKLYAEHDRQHAGLARGWHKLREIFPQFVRTHWAMATGGALGVAVLAGLLAGWLALQPASDGVIAEAIAAHRQWLQTPNTDNPGKGATQLAAFEAVNRKIFIPDLRASELRITRVSPFGVNGVHVGYQGTRGCHLSLFVQPTSALGNLPLDARMVSANEAYRWRLNSLDYVLLAVGMDPERLKLIADDVYLAVKRGQPFDRQTRMALRLNRQQSVPCAG